MFTKITQFIKPNQPKGDKVPTGSVNPIRDSKDDAEQKPRKWYEITTSTGNREHDDPNEILDKATKSDYTYFSTEAIKNMILKEYQVEIQTKPIEAPDKLNAYTKRLKYNKIKNTKIDEDILEDMDKISVDSIKKIEWLESKGKDHIFVRTSQSITAAIDEAYKYFKNF